MQSNQKKYNTYRDTFPEMVYESYLYETAPDGLYLRFCFTIGKHITFEPEAFIPCRGFLSFDQPKALLDNLVFNIGMAELVSYWKCVCPPSVIIKPHTLDDTQKAFWLKLYYNGLGEFFYTNGIRATLDDFMSLHCDALASTLSAGKCDLSDSYLVPIGGGKDSVVTLELLRSRGVMPLIMNPRGATTQCAARGGFDESDTLVIRRTLDKRLLDLNAKGCLNGHTPFSAMLAFYTALAAVVSGRRNIALSNENSANEATVAGSTVNHQYSKSLEFENDFRRYLASYVCPDINYFSFLRPLSELQIAGQFARNEQYYDVFRSCNAGSKQDIWCGNCAKCLFAYIILSPFIAPERLNAIFGKAMLDDASLRGYFEELAGHTDSKPFECVGTIDEVNTAMAMTKRRWYSAGNEPLLLKTFEYDGPLVRLDTLFGDHNLSGDELEILKRAIAEVNV